MVVLKLVVRYSRSLLKLIRSPYPVENLYALLYALVGTRNFYKSFRVRFINEGKLVIRGILSFGYHSNEVGMSPNSNGILRIYKGGIFNIRGNVRIARSCKVYVAGVLNIGTGTYLNPNTLIFSRTSITIGCDCAISWDCQILDDDFHSVSNSEKSKPILIGDRVLIGSKSIILKGVEIGNDVVIASGSIVTRSVPSNSLVAGNPAKILRSIKTWT